MYVVIPFFPLFIFLNQSLWKNLYETNVAKQLFNSNYEKEATNSQRETNFDTNKYQYSGLNNPDCATSDYRKLTLEKLKQTCGKRQDEDYESNTNTAIIESFKFINKSPAKLGEWPWMAFLKISYDDNKIRTCGGVLITDEVVLTAAHCLMIEGSSIDIELGGLNQYINEKPKQTFRAKSFTIHETFVSGKSENDIALLWLDKKADFDCFVAPICLPFAAGIENKDLHGISTWIAGYSSLEDDDPPAPDLWKIEVQLISNDSCSGNHICNTKPNNGQCIGDSGDPLMIKFNKRWYVIGIISRVQSCISEEPVINTRVIHYEDWIENNIELLKEQVRNS